MWQPIETAPRDGSIITVRQGRWAPCHVRWKDGGWDFISYSATNRPTHWLPDPPVGESK